MLHTNYFIDKKVLRVCVELRHLSINQYQLLFLTIVKFDSRHVLIIVIFLSKLWRYVELLR